MKEIFPDEPEHKEPEDNPEWVEHGSKANDHFKVIVNNFICRLVETERMMSEYVQKRGDLGDLGNMIGIAIQPVIDDHDKSDGFDLEDFIEGIEHGSKVHNQHD